MFNLSETAKISCHYESFTTVEPSLGKRTELICIQYFTALHEKSGNFGRVREIWGEIKGIWLLSTPTLLPCKGAHDSHFWFLPLSSLHQEHTILIFGSHPPLLPCKEAPTSKTYELYFEAGGRRGENRRWESCVDLKQGGDERIEDESYLKLVGGLSGSWPWHMSRSRLSELAPLIIIMIKLSLFLYSYFLIWF